MENEKKSGGFYHGVTRFLACLVLILALPIFFIVLVAEGLYLPIDFAIYSFSRFKRETGIGYSFYASGKTAVKLYKLVKKHSLPLEFIHWGSLRGACFISADKLYICDSPAIHFVEESGGLCVHPDHSESEECRYISIPDYINSKIEEHNAKNPEKQVKSALIVARRGLVEPDAVAAAEESDLILVFKGKGELLSRII